MFPSVAVRRPINHYRGSDVFTTILQDFWGVLWTLFSIFIFVAYLMVLFSIISDIFRDHKLAGGWKALWIVALLFVPLITALVYLIARGKGMAERQNEAVRASQTAASDWVTQNAATGPAGEIAAAKSLLDSGAISQEEFDALKKKALA